MSDYTENYELKKLGAGDSLSDDNYAFGTSNLDRLDVLVKLGAETHRHTGAAEVEPSLEVGSRTLVLTPGTSSGSIPAGVRVHYRFTVTIDGTESSVSDIYYVDTPPPVASPLAPDLSTSSTGGVLLPGNYYYVLTAYVGTNTEESRGIAPRYILVPSGTGTNTVLLSLPDLPDDADGFNIYRKKPGGVRYDYVTSIDMQVATPPSTWLDDGSIEEDCDRTIPAQNFSNTRNHVEVEMVGDPLDPGDTWTLYRTYVEDDFLDSRIATALDDTDVYDDLGVAGAGSPPSEGLAGVSSPSKILLTSGAEVQGILPRSMVEPGGGGKTTKVLIAAANSPQDVQDAADYLCDGINDQDTFQEALASLISSTVVDYADFDDFADGYLLTDVIYEDGWWDIQDANGGSTSTWEVLDGRVFNNNSTGALGRYIRPYLHPGPFPQPGYGWLEVEIEVGASGYAGIRTSGNGSSPAVRLSVADGVEIGLDVTGTFTPEAAWAPTPVTIVAGQTYTVRVEILRTDTGTGDYDLNVWINDVQVLDYTGDNESFVVWSTEPSLVTYGTGTHYWDNVRYSAFDIDPATIVVADGDYYFTGPLWLRMVYTQDVAGPWWNQGQYGNISIQGTSRNAIIHAVDGFPVGMSLFDWWDYDSDHNYMGGGGETILEISHLTFVDPLSVAGGIRLADDGQLHDIHDCFFDTLRTGISLGVYWLTTTTWYSGSDQAKITANRFEDITEYGIFAREAYEGIINGNYIDMYWAGASLHDASAGVYLYECGAWIVANNTIMDAVHNIHIEDEFPGSNYPHLINGNYLIYANDDDNGPVVESANMYAARVGGIQIIGNTIDESNVHGIVLVGCEGAHVANNDITYNGFYGILVAGCIGTLISGNLIAENGWEVEDTYAQIFITNDGAATPSNSSDNAIIGGNKIRRLLSSGEYYGSVPSYGIEIDTGSEDTYIFGNDLRDSGNLGDIEDNGTGTDTTSTNRV